MDDVGVFPNSKKQQVVYECELWRPSNKGHTLQCWALHPLKLAVGCAFPNP